MQDCVWGTRGGYKNLSLASLWWPMRPYMFMEPFGSQVRLLLRECILWSWNNNPSWLVTAVKHSWPDPCGWPIPCFRIQPLMSSRIALCFSAPGNPRTCVESCIATHIGFMGPDRQLLSVRIALCFLAPGVRSPSDWIHKQITWVYGQLLGWVGLRGWVLCLKSSDLRHKIGTN